MQNMLKKIIEMDEQARLVKEQAIKDKAATEQEIIETKKKIYNDYIDRAKDRVRKNLEVDRANAEKEKKKAQAKNQETLVNLDKMYSENHDMWVNQIVERVIND